MKKTVLAILTVLSVLTGCGEPDPIEKDTTDATMSIDEMYADSVVLRWTGIHITRDSSETAEYIFRLASKEIDLVEAERVGLPSLFVFFGDHHKALLIQDVNNKSDLGDIVKFDVTKIDTVQCDKTGIARHSIGRDIARVDCVVYSIDNEIISQFSTDFPIYKSGYDEYVYIPMLEVHKDGMINDVLALDVFDPSKGFDGRSFDNDNI